MYARRQQVITNKCFTTNTWRTKMQMQSLEDHRENDIVEERLLSLGESFCYSDTFNFFIPVSR